MLCSSCYCLIYTVSVHLFILLSTVSIYLFILLYICLSIYPSIYLSIYPSFYLSIYLSFYISICLFIILLSIYFSSIYLSIWAFLLHFTPSLTMNSPPPLPCVQNRAISNFLQTKGRYMMYGGGNKAQLGQAAAGMLGRSQEPPAMHMLWFSHAHARVQSCTCQGSVMHLPGFSRALARVQSSTCQGSVMRMTGFRYALARVQSCTIAHARAQSGNLRAMFFNNTM